MQYFGANAAWLRLAMITHNLLTALKRLALPAELLRARPKRLRFLISIRRDGGSSCSEFDAAFGRSGPSLEQIASWREAFRLLPVGT